MKYAKPVVLVLIIAGLAGGLYYWRAQQQPEAPPPPAMPASPPKPAGPSIQFPVPQPSANTEKPLPPLDHSDSAMLDVLSGFFGSKSVNGLFIPEDIVHRFVVAVDNLPRAKMPMRFQLFKPAAGRFLVSGADENLSISPKNYNRYTPYVLMAEAVDSKTLVATYIRYYPLFQQEYKTLGYPHGYFNDRLVEAIDNMLATPNIIGPVKLVQPNVLYQFANPQFETLSAGQKILLRMGPDNASRIKAKLTEIRRDLTGQSP